MRAKLTAFGEWFFNPFPRFFKIVWGLFLFCVIQSLVSVLILRIYGEGASTNLMYVAATYGGLYSSLWMGVLFAFGLSMKVIFEIGKRSVDFRKTRKEVKA